MNEDEKNAILLSHYRSIRHYEELARRIRALFEGEPTFRDGLYIIKHRIKNEDRLIEKIDERNKNQPSPVINRRNYQTKVEDIVGIRIICFRPSDVKKVAEFISALKKEGKLAFRGPENKKPFQWHLERAPGLSSEVDFQYSGYSSVDYKVRLGKSLSPPLEMKKIRAEIQLRTIFEEAWGELDHRYRYELARKGAKVPDHIGRGFFDLAAYLQVVASQAEHLCRESEEIRAKMMRQRRKQATIGAKAAPEVAPPPTAPALPAPRTIDEVVETKFSFSPSPTTTTYIQRRLEDAFIYINQPPRLAMDVLTDEAISEFRRLFAEEMSRGPFVEPASRDIDLVNLINYALFRHIQRREVAIEGLRSVLRGRL